MAEVARVRVLHLLATSQRRGAEVFAADLVRAMGEGGSEDHRVASLRGGDLAFSVPTTVLRAGRPLPGFRVDPAAMIRLRRLVAEWRPQVITAHGGEAFKYAILAGRGRAAVVYLRIGWAAPWSHRGLRVMAYRRMMRRAAAVVCAAEAIRQETIERFGVPEDRIITIPNSADPRRLVPSRDRLATRQTLGIDEDVPVLISVGALVWEKDPLAHLEVSERIRQEIPALAHIIVGDGPLRAPLEDAVGRRGLDDSVLLIGSRSDVPDLLAASDLLLLASRSEGLPIVLIEAGMVGVPVAAYDVAGVSEIVVDGETGVLVPAGDVETLSNAAVKLLAEPVARRAMGEAARRHCLGRFDVRAAAARYRSVFHEVARR